MRNSTKFRDLFVEYLPAPHSEKREMIEELRKSAKKFFDFAMLFQFDRYGREEAFDKMMETYLQEKYSIRIQLNILDLFDAIDEWNEDHEEEPINKIGFLDEFFEKHHERKEDLLFYLAETEGCGRYESKAENKLLKLYYATESGMLRGVNAKIDRNSKMSIASLFGKKSLDVLGAI
jgi:hypothetical protein